MLEIDASPCGTKSVMEVPAKRAAVPPVKAAHECESLNGLGMRLLVHPTLLWFALVEAHHSLSVSHPMSPMSRERECSGVLFVVLCPATEIVRWHDDARFMHHDVCLWSSMAHVGSLPLSLHSLLPASLPALFRPNAPVEDARGAAFVLEPDPRMQGWTSPYLLRVGGIRLSLKALTSVSTVLDEGIHWGSGYVSKLDLHED